MKESRLKIEYVQLAALAPYPDNARTHSTAQITQIADSMRKLANRAIEYSSRTGEIVLDCFGGSGSTLMACEQLDRRARLLELDPPYCDVIVERWQNFTGSKAERIKSRVAA